MKCINYKIHLNEDYQNDAKNFSIESLKHIFLFSKRHNKINQTQNYHFVAMFNNYFYSFFCYSCDYFVYTVDNWIISHVGMKPRMNSIWIRCFHLVIFFSFFKQTRLQKFETSFNTEFPNDEINSINVALIKENFSLSLALCVINSQFSFPKMGQQYYLYFFIHITWRSVKHYCSLFTRIYFQLNLWLLFITTLQRINSLILSRESRIRNERVSWWDSN